MQLCTYVIGTHLKFFRHGRVVQYSVYVVLQILQDL